MHLKKFNSWLTDNSHIDPLLFETVGKVASLMFESTEDVVNKVNDELCPQPVDDVTDMLDKSNTDVPPDDIMGSEGFDEEIPLDDGNESMADIDAELDELLKGL